MMLCCSEPAYEHPEANARFWQWHFCCQPAFAAHSQLLNLLSRSGTQGRLKVCLAHPWQLCRCLVCSRGVPLRDARDRSSCP
jgi:hypothetical protein